MVIVKEKDCHHLLSMKKPLSVYFSKNVIEPGREEWEPRKNAE